MSSLGRNSTIPLGRSSGRMARPSNSLLRRAQGRTSSQAQGVAEIFFSPSLRIDNIRLFSQATPGTRLAERGVVPDTIATPIRATPGELVRVRGEAHFLEVPVAPVGDLPHIGRFRRRAPLTHTILPLNGREGTHEHDRRRGC